VIIVGFLSPVLLMRLRGAVGKHHRIVAVGSLPELEQALRANTVDLTILEPAVVGPARMIPLLGVLARHPSLAVAIYTGVTPDVMRAAVEYGARGVRHLFVVGEDDHPATFREALEAIPADRLTMQAVAALRPMLDQLPPELARAIEHLFRDPNTVRDVRDLVRWSRLPRRSLDRALERAGFCSAYHLVRSARVTRAFLYMRDPGYRIEDVAMKLGYLSPERFARDVRTMTGLPPSVLRDTLEPSAFVEQLVARLYRRRRLQKL
jgi:AraC-like DNA-binding protein